MGGGESGVWLRGFETDSGRDRGRTGRKVRGEGRRSEGEVNRRWGWAAMKRNARRDGTNRDLITRYKMEGARFDM